MNRDIAIIGLGGRFPEALTIQEFYQNLKNGRDSVVEMPMEEKQRRTIPLQDEYSLLGYVKDIDKFDYKFFNIPLVEAQHMDPVQRQLLEVAYETIESSGYHADYFSGTKTALFLGHAEYFYNFLFSEEALQEPSMFTGINHFSVAGRISRLFDFRGNSGVVNTGCSSALNAVHLACNEIIFGEADYAMALGVRICVYPPSKKPELFDVGIEAENGKTKAFAEGSDGSGEAEMVGSVLLKPLDKAIADKDKIYAVIKATVANQSGQLASSLTATCSAAQADMIREAWRKADIDPLSISYIEAHGSGTKLGDPMEIAGIDMAYQGITDKKHFVGVSTVKTNIGHADTGAGMAGLIKAILSVHHKELFASLHFHKPNPFIDFENSVTYIPTALKKWEPENGICRAGVTSLGFTGNNVHVILEEPPERIIESGSQNKPYLITVSAKFSEGLKRNMKALLHFLLDENESELRDISFTLSQGRKHYDYRYAVIVESKNELIKLLTKEVLNETKQVESKDAIKKLLFVFSDNTPVNKGLIKNLSGNFSVFKDAFESCKTLFPLGKETEYLNRFTFQYSFYQLITSFGLNTKSLVGLGIGKHVTAVLSGRLTLEEGIKNAAEYQPEEISNLPERLKTMVEKETEKENVLFVEMGVESAISKGLRNLPVNILEFYEVLSLSETEKDPVLSLFRDVYLMKYNISWDKFASHYKGYRISLPAYQFEKIRCWIQEPTEISAEAFAKDSVSEKQEWTKENFSNSHKIPSNLNINKDWTSTEQQIARIWMEVLKLQSVELTDDFFALGGHSLFLIQVNNRVEQGFGFKFELKEMFAFATIKALAMAVDIRLKGSSFPLPGLNRIKPVKEQEYYPLSFSQKRLWVLSQFEESSIAYNLPEAYLFEGSINQRAFEKAFETLIERHESLRTIFVQVDAEPMQKILSFKELNFNTKKIDISKALDKEERMMDLANEEAVSPFDLSAGPLLRVKLIYIEENKHMVLLNLHHIISDGWSSNVLISEVLALYEAFNSGNPNPLEPLHIQYKDYAAWQNEQLSGEELKTHKEYWLSQFKGEIPVLNLPSEKTRPAVQTFNGDIIDFHLDKHLLEGIHSVGQSNNVTLFMTLVAAIKTLFYKYSGQTDIIIGTPTAGRDHTELENQIGFYINTLALRTQFESQNTFADLLQKVKGTVLGGFEHQVYPFDHLVDELQLDRDLSRSPLFDVVVILHNMIQEHEEDAPETMAGLEVKPFKAKHQVSQRDMTFSFTEVPDGIMSSIEYNTDIYSQEGMRNLVKHLNTILSELLLKPETRLQDVNYLSSEETQRFVFDFNNTAFDYDKQKSIVQLFQEQLAKAPDNIAISEGERSISYKELNKKSNQLARNLNIKSGSVVGLLAGPSIEAVISVLAILKAGGVYLPIDPEIPFERKIFMLNDTAAKRLLIQQNLANKNQELLKQLPEEKIFILNDENAYHADDSEIKKYLKADDTAYIIYTSGSTGGPKGVLVQHRGLTNYISWASRMYVRDERVNFPLFTSLAFDLTITSIFTPLITGNAIIVYHNEDKTQLIENIFNDNKVGVVKLTPAHLKLLRNKKFTNSNIKRLIVGGENLETSLAREITKVFGNKIEILNEYGPTETVVGCMIHRFDPIKDKGRSVPIGKPADNVQIYLLDENLHPIGAEVPGELYISGDGLAKAYLNREDLTAERFIANPFIKGKKMYKTGDKARFLNDGNIEFLGRTDKQVKIRGYRVELGEIESELLRYDGITDVVVNSVQNKSFVKPDFANVKCCIKCGLPSNYPEAIFDNEGVCNMCTAFDSYKDKAQAYFKTTDHLKAIFEKASIKKTSSYDCMMLLSGGKDSTYVLYQLVKEMGLKVLVYSFDNGFISEGAKTNIRRVTDELGVDLVWGSTEHMNSIFVDSLKRYSNVCNGCFKTIYTLAMSLAVEKGIKLIVTGLSRGQLFETRLNELYNTSKIFNVEEIDDLIIDARKTYHRADDSVSQLLDTAVFKNDKLFDEYQFIDFFRYSDVKLEDMYAYLDENAPWVRPVDTGRSTNCLINELGIYIHKKERGFHNYALPYSWDVRMGHKTRKEALEELDDRIKREGVRKMLNQIGYDEDRLEKEAEEKTLVAYITSNKELVLADLRKHLSERLPEYMIPVDFVLMEKIPLTANGKIDYKALPDPDGISLKNKYVAPRNAMEVQVTEITESILAKKQVSVKDNFFEIGGHSLKAVQLISRLNKELSVKLNLPAIYAHPTIEKLVMYISRIGKAEFKAILPVTEAEYYDVSWSQLNYLGTNAMGEDILSFRHLFENLEKNALIKALDALVERHESLRTVFFKKDGIFKQKIKPAKEIGFKIEEIDLSVNAKAETIINEMALENNYKSFDLEKGPLIRAKLIKKDEQKYEFLFAIHHITFDGWSLEILGRELNTLYDAYKEGRENPLNPLSIQYKDFAIWQNNLLESSEINEHREYWHKRLGKGLAKINLPVDYAYQDDQSEQIDAYKLIVDNILQEKLKKLANDSAASLYGLLLTAYNILLSKITGSHDITIVSPVSGREHDDIKDITGFFVNFLLLRNEVNEEKTFREVLSETSRDFMEALTHQVYPLEKLFEELKFSKNDFTPVMLNMHNFDGQEEIVLEDLESKHKSETVLARVDLACIIDEFANAIAFSFIYKKALFKPTTIENIAKKFLLILEDAVSDPDKEIREFEVFSNEALTVE